MPITRHSTGIPNSEAHHTSTFQNSAFLEEGPRAHLAPPHTPDDRHVQFRQRPSLVPVSSDESDGTNTTASDGTSNPYDNITSPRISQENGYSLSPFDTPSHVLARVVPTFIHSITACPERKEKDHKVYGMRSVLIRDFIIGFSDGLTVPFALTAGLSVLGNPKLVIIGGLAELFSGCISMGLGAFQAANVERQHYQIEERKVRKKVQEQPLSEEEKTCAILERYGITRSKSVLVVEELKKNETAWVQFMMDFELKLERPRSRKAWIEGLVMGFAFLVGGIFPLLPYFFLKSVVRALYVSIGITALILLLFGYGRARIVGTTKRAAVLGGLQTLLIGGIAAGTAYGIVYASSKLTGQTC